MPLARIILKSHTGVSLHDRFTRFMKQRGAEEAKSDQQRIHRQLPMRSTGATMRGSSDKNRKLALEMERRMEGRETRERRERSRSPPLRRDRSSGRVNENSRDGGRGQSRREEAQASVKDRIGRRPVKDRIEMPPMSDRLGSRPMSDRIDQSTVRRNQAQYAREQQQQQVALQRKAAAPRNNTPNGRGARTGGAGRGAGRPERRSVPDQEKLDKDMENYMKQSKHGLDSMLDDYMKAGPKKSKASDDTATAEAPVADATAQVAATT